MNFGYNSNVAVGNAIYHVQSEDRGQAHPFLDTVVYLAGRVVYKRSSGYGQIVQSVPAESLAQKLHELLSQQHRAVIAELEAGTLRMNVTEKREFTAGGQSQPGHQPPTQAATARAEKNAGSGLDLRLLNPKGWFNAGKVTLKLALFDKSSKQTVHEATTVAYLENNKEHTPCAEARTDSKGCATLQFRLPSNPSEGTFLVVRATHSSRIAELRFHLKAKPRTKAPTPAPL